MSILLEASSYQTITVALPSIGAQASSASYRDDVHAIRSTLQELVEDKGKDVLLAVHSYGAVPGCQTVGGLEKNAHVKEGKKGAVVHVLFMVALLVEQGKRLRDVLEGGLPAWAAFDVRLVSVTSAELRLADKTLVSRAKFSVLLMSSQCSIAI